MKNILLSVIKVTKALGKMCFEHLHSFKKYSKNKIWYFDSTRKYFNKSLNFNFFDAIIIHWNILITSEYFLAKKVSDSISDFLGLKILFIQDEYRDVQNINKKISSLKIDLVFSSLNKPSQKIIYKELIKRNVKIFSTLTGYLPDKNISNFNILPISKRKTEIFYRGRDVPYYWELLEEKKDNW